MSLRMNEADWQIALEVFRACLPARGAKAKDDRSFLEALHFSAVHNITWRTLPERFGNWSSSVRQTIQWIVCSAEPSGRDSIG